MFGFSWGEILVFLIVAIIFVDPKDIPKFTRDIAGFIRKMKASTREFTEVFTKEFEAPKTYIKDLKGNLQETVDISDFKKKL